MKGKKEYKNKKAHVALFVRPGLLVLITMIFFIVNFLS